MPYDGSGNFTPLSPPAFPALSGNTIQSTYFNSVVLDLITNGLSKAFVRDGQSPALGNFNLNGNKVINLANGVNPQDAATMANLNVFQTGVSSLEVDIARRSPPGAGGYDCFLAWPTPIAGSRAVLKALPNKIFLLRVWQANGIVRELGLLRLSNLPDQNGIDDGLEVLWDYAYVNNSVQRLLLQPFAGGARTSTMFAVRHGRATDSNSVVANNISGHSHGKMKCPGGANLQKEATGPNLLNPANLPIGDQIFGEFFNETTTYNLLLPDGVTTGIVASVARNFDNSYGHIDDIYLTPQFANCVWIDSPVAMHAATSPASGGWADTAKFSSISPAVALVGSGGQKGNWRKSIATTSTNRFQFYKNISSTLIYYLESAKGPFTQNPAETFTPGQECDFGFAHVTDETDFVKFAGYGVTAPDGSTTPKALPSGTTRRFYNRRHIAIFPAGPS